MTDVQIALAEERYPLANGQELILKPCNGETERDYTNYLDKEAIEGMIRHRKSWGTEYREARADLAQRLHTLKVNAWRGEMWKESTGNAQNVEKLLYLTFRQEHPALGESEFHDIFMRPEKRINEVTGNEEDSIQGRRMWDNLKEFLDRPN